MDTVTPRKRVLFMRSPRLLACLLLLNIALLTNTFLIPARQVNAVTNPTLNFQARLMTSSGAISGDGNYNIEFKLYSASSGGTALWTEDWLNSASQGIRVVNGYLTASLGSITSFANATTPIPWGSPLWLTINIGGTSSGTPTWDGEMSPRLSLTAVPAALSLVSANSSGNVSTLGFVQPTASESILLPAESGATEYVCYQNDTNCGFLSSTSGVLLQATTPGTAQTGNINITGTLIAGVLQAGSLDTAGSGGTLNIGAANATTIGIGNATSSTAVTIYGGTGATAINLTPASGGSVNETTAGAGKIVLTSATQITAKITGSQTAAFQIQNNGGTALLDADTQNTRIGINNGGPSYTLDVVGDINTSTIVRVAGTDVCDTTGSTGCIAKSGSGYYIHNQTTIQTGANFYIQGAASTVAGVLEANGADILDLQNSSAVPVATFNSTGVLTVIGAQSADITTFNSASATANGLTIQPGTSGGAASSGGTVTIQGGAGAGTGTGGLLTLQGGTGGTGAAAAGGGIQIQGGAAAGTGVSNGGNIVLQGGAASGSGVRGQIQINGALVYTTTTFSSGTSATITQSAVDSNTTVLATATATGLTFTVPSPTIATSGRIVQVSNAGTNAFILSGTGTNFTLNAGSTATLMWNGSAWTNAGVDASTLQTAYTNSIGNTTPIIKLDSTRKGINIQDADSSLGGSINFLSFLSSNAAGLGTQVFGFGINGTYFQKPKVDGLDFEIQQNNGGTTNTAKDVFSVDTTASASVVNLGSTSSGSGYNGSTVNIVTTNNANGTVNIGGSSLAGSATQTINIGYTATSTGTTNVNIGSASPGGGATTVRAAGALTLTGGAASTWSTTSGTLTLQAAGSLTMSGTSATLTGSAASSFTTTGGNLTISDSDATGKSVIIDESGTGGSLNLGNATATINIAGTGASNNSRTINIATGATTQAQTVTIGNTANTGASTISLNAGVGSGSVSINTGSQTATTSIGNSSAGAISITSSSQTTIQGTTIPLFLNSTSATDRESAILYELNGVAAGEIGLTGTATKIINQTAANDLAIKSISGNIWLAAGGTTGQVKISGTNGSALFQNSADSQSAFVVQNSGGTATAFTVDTSDNDIILGNATSDPTGLAGAMYYNSSTGQFRCYNGRWQNCMGIDSDAFRRQPFYATDFLDAGSLVSGVYLGAGAPWNGYQLGSGTISGGSLTTQSAGHPGVVRIASTTSSGSGARYALNGSSFFMTAGLSYELVFNIDTISNTNMRIGFYDVSGTGTPGNGMWISVSGSGSTLTMAGNTESGGVGSTTGTTYASGSAGTWYRAKIVANSSNSGVTFYLYNDSGTQLWTDSLTTNLPTTNTNQFTPGVIAWSTNTATTNLVDLDYMSVWWATSLVR